jgi:Domain of unknown function (DUF4157)
MTSAASLQTTVAKPMRAASASVSLQRKCACGGLASPGQPLEPALRLDMEQRFAHDFSRVRVHADAAAGESPRDVNAHAYTVQQSAQRAGVLQRSPDEGQKPPDKPAAKFASCSADQEKTLVAAIAESKGFATRALQAFTREYPLSYEATAMRDHFGSLASDQKTTIVQRYKDVLANVDGKSYTCARTAKKVTAGSAIVDLCGQAQCPGSAITLFPVFGTATCPAGPVLLHEALHNAGACDDIDKGTRYPPSSSEDNAYSYEYFALAVAGGLKTPELGKRKPQAPKIKD